MLLFIFINLWKPPLNVEFKYISCYYLSSKGATQEMVDIIQIHLMLLFILTLLISLSKTSIIQIHLMLLFIKYVTTHTGILKSIQIHLMLLFIVVMCFCFLKIAAIQIHLMLLFIFLRRSTS